MTKISESWLGLPRKEKCRIVCFPRVQQQGESSGEFLKYVGYGCHGNGAPSTPPRSKKITNHCLK